MFYRKIENIPLDVSAICLGGVALSTPGDHAGVGRLIDRYLELGGNMIDTANVYGKWFPGGQGTSEQNIGAWLSGHRSRQDVLIATKGGHPELSSMTAPRLSRADIQKDLAESLRNIGTDYIDLYWLHRDDPAKPAGEMVEYLGDLVKEGKIRAFGCSNWQPQRIAEAISYAAEHKVTGFCANQLMWSLAQPNTEALSGLVAMNPESMALHKANRLPAFAYMSLANGLFSKLADGSISSLDSRLRQLYENGTNLSRFVKARTLALDLNISATAVSVCYLLNQADFTTIPIAGCRTVSQLEEVMAAGSIKLDAAALAELIS